MSRMGKTRQMVFPLLGGEGERLLLPLFLHRQQLHFPDIHMIAPFLLPFHPDRQ